MQTLGHILVNRRNAQSVSGNVFLKFLQFVHKNVFDSFFLRFGLRFQYVFVVPAFFLTFSSSRGRFWNVFCVFVVPGNVFNAFCVSPERFQYVLETFLTFSWSFRASQRKRKKRFLRFRIFCPSTFSIRFGTFSMRFRRNPETPKRKTDENVFNTFFLLFWVHQVRTRNVSRNALGASAVH